MPEPSGLYYPNRFARYFFLAVEEALGREGAEAAFAQAGLDNLLDPLPPDTLDRQFDFAYLAAFSQALTDIYGPRGGRGFDLSIGRAWFRQGMHSFGALAGLADPAFQMLLLNERVRIALNALASTFARHSDQPTRFIEQPESYLLVVESSPLAWHRSADRPVCHALVGLTQECIKTASNGFEFHVHEQTCIASGGDSCSFVVNKKPIGHLAGG